MEEAALLHNFISMGCDCEFGSVQRQFRVEPPDLLRWGGTDLPTVIRMLEDCCEHIGDKRYLEVSLEKGEYFISNSYYGFKWHSWVKDGEMSAERILKREITRLPRQAEILIDDLSQGKRIVIRKAKDISEICYISAFVASVGRFGSAHVLFVSQDNYKSGTVERTGPRLLRGYLSKFADPADIMANADPTSWLPLCRKAAALVSER